MPDALILAILEEGKRKRQEILEHAREEAARIASAAALHKEESDRIELLAFRRQMDDRASRRLNAARKEAVRVVSFAEERVIEAATGSLGAKLEAMRETLDYDAILTALFREVAGEITPGSSIRAEDPEIRRLTEMAASAGMDVKFSETAGMGGGVEVVSADGNITLRNTFQSRIERARELIIREIGQRLRTLDVQSGLPDQPA